MGPNATAIVDGTDAAVDCAQAGEEMYRLAAELYPICRSITGNGVRETLRVLQRQVPLEIHEVATGTRVFDWTVPREWNIRDAYIADEGGRRLIDFRDHNLHVLNYSVPVDSTVTLDELRPHLHTLPEHPDWIPYRTSYYDENWGFCLTHNQLAAMAPGRYRAVIDSTLTDGALTYGEYRVAGESDEEVLLSCHICHPSLANDNLSGIALVAWLARHLAARRPRYSYRFLFVPGTIGSITWLSRNRDRVERIRHGLVVVCVGDRGAFTYKRSRRGDAAIDRAVVHVLEHSGMRYRVTDFTPYGYDERQYCSPGFDLAVGCLSRSSHGQYPEYHSSADDLGLISAQCLGESLALYLKVLAVLDNDRTLVRTNPYCEPQLRRHGLYRAVGGSGARQADEMTMLWVLNLADGRHSLLDVASRAGLPFASVDEAARLLSRSGLLRDAGDDA